MTTPPIRVLVVDDSAFARKVMREVLRQDPAIDVVGTACDGLEALEKIATLRPDVVTLDLIMPELDGVSVLRALRGRPDAPRCIVVSSSHLDSDVGVQALQAGAFDVLEKPTSRATDRLYLIQDQLLHKVKLAAGHKSRPPADEPAPVSSPTPRASRARIVVIGASTGGPTAIRQILRALPNDFPVPIAIVLHMPPGYTDAMARRLNGECALEIFEVSEGVVIAPGQAGIARAGVHLRLQRVGASCRAIHDPHPTEGLHCPAVDELFLSAADQYGASALGAVLTGMGEDGTEGARAIRAAGGRVLTEEESSCVVYGMPRTVVEAGLSSGRAPITDMAQLIIDSL